MKNVISCEKEIKKAMIKIHQETLGKGPEEAWIKINRNIGTFYYSGTLTRLEENLLLIPDGEEEVLRLRRMIIRQQNSFLCEEIKIVAGVEVKEITGKICVHNDIYFGTVLFDKSLE